jgi:predicted oxidoreductase
VLTHSPRATSSTRQTISEYSLTGRWTRDLIDRPYSQDETSEVFIGEWVEKRGIRDQLVIATKYTTNFKRGQGKDISHMVNYSGNNAKSLHVSVEASLKKLRTTYIDILYLHWWDYSTSVEEVMNALHVLVQQGKVLYLVRYLIWFHLCYEHCLVSHPGHLRYSRLGGFQGKPVCQRSRKDTFLHLPG